jgi:hypothetical protein
MTLRNVVFGFPSKPRNSKRLRADNEKHHGKEPGGTDRQPKEEKRKRRKKNITSALQQLLPEALSSDTDICFMLRTVLRSLFHSLHKRERDRSEEREVGWVFASLTHP